MQSWVGLGCFELLLCEVAEMGQKPTAELSVLAFVGFALSEDGTGILGGADPDRGLRDLPDVTGSLRRLHLAKLVTATDEGNFRWRVGWGERALKIAREAGVRLPKDEKLDAVATG